MTFKKEDYSWITNLGDNTLYQNGNHFALVANENIQVKRTRVAKLNDAQLDDMNELIKQFDDAEYSDDTDFAEHHIEQLIIDNEIEQYIGSKQVK